ncbi:MAG: hypothetical protein HKN23_20700 [Verrucomicrobiales bacterium]|nr:hypothetical protein [Verrucomicrobiales bacterium]
MSESYEPIFGKVAQSALTNPGHQKPHVLVLSERPPADFAHADFLISWAPAPNTNTKFPPEARAYQNEAQYLWRWILQLGPDFVVTENESLATALDGKIPSGKTMPNSIKEPSAIRIELQKRASRSPIQVAEALSNHYGHKFGRVSYIPALAMVGRLRLAELTESDVTAEIAALAKSGKKPPVISGAAVSGHLIFAELGLKEDVITAAESGIKNPAHNEMSDSVFMICPLLAAAGRMSGEDKYFQASVEHLERMQDFCLRDDGIYRHSPLDEAAWGRGNGFPALGLAWTLSEMPADFPGQKKVLVSFQNHLSALAKHQDASGMWHQVIDKPGSYREFTSTCMITFAMLRGMRNGWLDRDTFEPLSDRGWNAIKKRVSLDGKSIVDGCTGTGKQKSLQDYYLRTAILGPDDRCGAMALLLATERAFWEQKNAKAK